MLCDAALKYLATRASASPSDAAANRQQLAALRPLLAALVGAAGAHLRRCLDLHQRRGAVLTHSSSVRALCLLLRAALGLSAELMEPVILAHAAPAPGDAGGAALQGDAVPIAKAAHQLRQLAQQAPQLEPYGGQHDRPQEPSPPPTQAEQRAVSEQIAQLVAPPAPHEPTPAAAAAAVVASAAGAGGPPPPELGQRAAELLAQDAAALVAAAQVVLDLMAATLDAPPLLPQQAASPVGPSAAAARRGQQDTALWRAVEVSSDSAAVGGVGWAVAASA